MPAYRERKAARAPRVTIAAGILFLGALLGAQSSRVSSAPSLVIQRPDRLAGIARDLGTVDRNHLDDIARLVGLETPGPPILVILRADDSLTSRTTPKWVAGFASPEHDAVTLLTDRIGAYPFRSLENVLYHEVAHVLLHRATRGARLPRWFDEGLASVAERTWGLEERGRLTWALLSNSARTATDLEGLFSGDRTSVSRAYVLSHAVLRQIMEYHGHSALSRMLGRVRQGEPFELALFNVTGLTVQGVFERFWDRPSFVERWVPIVGHPLTLWGLITTLALLAGWRLRRQRAERRLRWEREEQAEELAWEQHRRRYGVH